MRLRSSFLFSLDTLLCFLAVLGLGCTLIPDYRRVASIDYVATDFKTLYASASLLAQHQDPYSIPALAAIFHRDSVVAPPTWFSRSPVYPPVTLNLIYPLTALPMPRAAQVWFALSLAAYAFAAASVLLAARRAGLGWPWRMGILALAVANPMLAYALEVGNASVLTSALSISAWMILTCHRAPGVRSWAVPALLLGAAILLKPHLAVWVVVGLAFFATRLARRAASASILLAAALTCISALMLAADGSLHGILHGYGAILTAEQASGSMSAGSRELLPLPAQITAAQSLSGLFLSPIPRNLLTAAILFAVAGCLFLSLHRRTQITDLRFSALAVSAVVAFGLIATYHRAHDSLILLPLLLWVALSLARPPRVSFPGRIAPMTILVLLLLLWVSVPTGLSSLRQAAFVLLLLSLALAWLQLLVSRQKKAA